MAVKVLVVDDEKLIVKGLKFSLEQDDMEVECAYDGEEALEYAPKTAGLSFRMYKRSDNHHSSTGRSLSSYI